MVPLGTIPAQKKLLMPYTWAFLGLPPQSSLNSISLRERHNRKQAH